jgi:SAM-dependent methyltransferase
MARARGASVSGIDVTPAFVTIAREQTPEGDFRLGDLQMLPWADDTFDVVNGFNSFFYADDLSQALREAHRVARPGARLALTAFGRGENGDFAPLFELLADALPALATDEDDAPPLEPFLTEAGFAVELAEYRTNSETYPDLDTLIRGYLAIGRCARSSAPSARRRSPSACETRSHHSSVVTAASPSGSCSRGARRASSLDTHMTGDR